MLRVKFTSTYSKCSKYFFRLLSVSRLGPGRWRRRGRNCTVKLENHNEAGQPSSTGSSRLNQCIFPPLVETEQPNVLVFCFFFFLCAELQLELNSNWKRLFHWWVWISQKTIGLLSYSTNSHGYIFSPCPDSLSDLLAVCGSEPLFV